MTWICPTFVSAQHLSTSQPNILFPLTLRPTTGLDKDTTTHVPIGHCDTDLWNIEVDCCSVPRVIFTFCGGVISWSIKTQKCIMLSSTTPEATCQALYMCKHLSALGVNPQQPLLLFNNNNQSTLAVINMSSGTYHSQMKHYDIKLAHLCDMTTLRPSTLQVLLYQ